MTKALARAVLALGLLLPTAALGQTVGTLVGHVYDQGGTPVAGVKIEVRSETQIGGPKATVTDDQGFFRLVGLVPGRFSVTASAPKLRSLVQNNVLVTQGGQTELDLILEIETADEQIQVVERAQPVDTSRPNIGESFDAGFLNSLPLSTRDFQGAAALAAGVRDDGSGNPSIRGGTYFNNSYQVDGFQTTDPVTQTFGQNFTFQGINTLDVQTAAYGAQNSSTTGGIINIVTKSGSNRFELQSTLTYQDHHLRFFEDARDRGENRLASLSVNVGGPILRDRVWFFLSTEAITNKFSLPRDPAFPDHPDFSTRAFQGLGKITWAVTPRNKLELKLIYAPAEFNNILQSYFVEPEAEARQFQGTRFAGLSWNSVLTDKILLNMRAGLQEIEFDIGPQSCQWDENCGDVASVIDLSTGMQRQNYSRQSREFRRTVELSGEFEWFASSRRWGSHNVKLGTRYLATANPAARTVPGDAIFFNNGTQPVAETRYCGNDPRTANGECRSAWLYTDVGGRSTLAFLQNAWKPTRYLTVTPGLGAHLAETNDDRSQAVTDFATLTPHLATVWDPTHDGRTALRASFNSYVDTGFLALARFSGRQLYSRQCRWDEEARAYIGNCRASGGNSSTTIGLPCGPTGVNADGTSCRTELRPPRTWEYTVGGEREIITGVSLGLDFVYRRFNHQWEDLETNAIWNQGGTDVRREGGWRTGRAEFVYDLETPDEARRRYRGLTLALRKREGLVRMQASYTWSRVEGTDDSGFATYFLDNPGQTPFYYGALDTDSRHDLRVQTSYAVRSWLALGVIYQFISGGPYNRMGFDAQTGGYTRFQTRRGYDWQGTLNPDDDVPLRLPDLSLLDLQARISFQRWLKQRVDLFVDVQNLLGSRTTVAVIEQDGPFFGRTAGRLLPTRARLGLEFRY